MCQAKCCRRPRNLLIMAIIWVILGAVFLVLAIMIKPLIQDMIDSQAKTATTLKGSNFDAWKNIPGNNNIMVLRDYYLYNCSNIEDMYFNQQLPHCYEQDPVQFYENATFSNPRFMALPRPTEPTIQNEAVRLDYQVILEKNAYYPYLNEKVVIPNQALFGIWQGAGQQERYGQAMTAFYNVIHGMETSLVDQAATSFFSIALPFIGSFETFQSNLQAKLTFTSAQIQNLWNDQYYGFNNKSDVSGIDQSTRVSLWTSLCPNSSQDSSLLNATTKNQFKTKFDLSHDLLQQFLETFICPGFNDAVAPVYLQACLNPDVSCTSLDVAFGQWNRASVTQINQQASISIADPTILGFPEMSYFLSQYFSKAPNEYVPDGAYQQFSQVDFLGQQYFSLLNYMNLTESCLLYLDSMRLLLQVGDNYDIKAHTTQNPTTRKLTTDFTAFDFIAKKFNVTSMEAYVLYCYIDALIARTLIRTSDGGNGHILAISSLATSGVKKEINQILAYDLPRSLYALLINDSLTGDCNARVQRYLPSLDEKSPAFTKICSTPGLNFESAQSLFNWVKFYTDQIPQTSQILVKNGLDPISIGEDILKPSGNFTIDIIVAKTKLKNWYQNQGSPCNFLYPTSTYCSDYEIAYLQWGFSNITLNPPTDLFEKSNSAKDLINSVAGKNIMRPQYSAFLNASSSEGMATYTPVDLLKQLDGGNLYNMKKTQDLFLDQSIENGVFNSSYWRDFLRYSTLEFSFGGLFKTVTIEEALHGYEDPVLKSIKDNAVYAGGVPYMNSKLALINPDVSHPSFFTGADDYTMGKVYAEYNGSPLIKIKKQVPQGNGSYYTDELVRPWKEESPLKGTDASKFKPMSSKSDQLWSFVTDIMIPLEFQYLGEGKKDGLTTHHYQIKPEMLYNSARYPPNTLYYMDRFDGMANLTSFVSAPVFASQPRYLGVPNDQDGLRISKLIDKRGNLITPEHDRDFNHFYLEYYTGAQIEGYQRLQSNFYLENNLLFNMTTLSNEFNFLVPLAYVQRSTNLSSAQLDKLFGALKTAMNLQIPLIIVFALLCALFFALAIWMFVRRRKQMRRESYLLMDDLSSVGKQTVRSNPAVEAL